MTDEERARQLIRRRRLLASGLVGLMCLLILRLWYVQIRHGQDHVEAIQRQSIRRIRLSPVRGRMLADGGETVLVNNRPVYDLVFYVSEMRQAGRRDRTINYILEQDLGLSRVLCRDRALTRERLEEHIRCYPAVPLTLFCDLTASEMARAMAVAPPIAGMQIEARPLREYLFPGLATHVLGFVGRRLPNLSGELNDYSYVTRELAGRWGLELRYDDVLSGDGGARLVRVNTLGYVHEEIGRQRRPSQGKDLVVTLDIRAQRVAEELLCGHRGALVVVDVSTGAVKVMASAPTYSLSELTGEEYSKLRNDTGERPLRNRAVHADYTPGSILKPLIALAALEAGTVTPEATVNCPGFYKIGTRPIHCWRRSGHGRLNLVEAIRYSCNPFFIELGQRTGVDVIGPFLKACGLGACPRLDWSPGCGEGIVPSRDLAERIWDRPWIAVDTAYISMGQGAVNLSPLQAALYAGALSNGGMVFRPFLVQSILSQDGSCWQKNVPVVDYHLPVSDEALSIVQQGMSDAVNADDGTARMAQSPMISLAGKTGTAQVSTDRDERKDVWFIGYGPVEEPQYAIAVLIEDGDSGGKTAAPIAGRFFTEWLRAGQLHARF